MSDLVSRVLAAISETERLAEACPCVEFSIAPDPSRRGRYDLEAYAAGSMTEFDSVSPIGGLPEVYARHIARNDPAAVLRRCASDLRVLERHNKPEPMTPIQVRVWGFEVKCGHCSWTCYSDGEDMVRFPCPDLVDLADRYGISVEEETTGE